MRLAILASLVACSSPPASQAAPVAKTAPVPPASTPMRWFAGDVHMHVAPPDTDVDLSPEQIAGAAHAAGMAWVVLTPHLWPALWQRDRASYLAKWHGMAERARANTTLTEIPGIEWTTGDGHFTVAGIELDTLGANLLASAHAAGAFISVNHPFAVPTHIPGVAISDYDISYRVWTDHQRGFTALDGVEVWNVPLGLANVVSRPGGKTGEQRAWLAANDVVHREHRKITAVGGTDNHKRAVAATTWVLAPDASEASVLAALNAGRTCVGAATAGSFRARAKGATEWSIIGDSVPAPDAIELAWTGAAELFVDGVDAGEHIGGITLATEGALHTYRIEISSSRCNFIYANL
jgi:hypothetical protein